MKEKSLFEGYEFNREGKMLIFEPLTNQYFWFYPSKQEKENWLGEPTMDEYTSIYDIPMGGLEWRQHVVLDRFGKIVEEKDNERCKC